MWRPARRKGASNALLDLTYLDLLGRLIAWTDREDDPVAERLEFAVLPVD